MKKIFGKKKIGICHLCDASSKVNLLYIEKIFSKLLITNRANNFLLMCLNLARVFSLVSHSTDVFSIWHSKILLLAYNFILKNSQICFIATIFELILES